MPATVHPKKGLSQFRTSIRAKRKTGFINFVTNTFKRFTQKNPAKIYIVDNKDNKDNFTGLGKKTRKRRPCKK